MYRTCFVHRRANGKLVHIGYCKAGGEEGYFKRLFTANRPLGGLNAADYTYTLGDELLRCSYARAAVKQARAQLDVVPIHDDYCKSAVPAPLEKVSITPRAQTWSDVMPWYTYIIKHRRDGRVISVGAGHDDDLRRTMRKLFYEHLGELAVIRLDDYELVVQERMICTRIEAMRAASVLGERLLVEGQPLLNTIYGRTERRDTKPRVVGTLNDAPRPALDNRGRWARLKSECTRPTAVLNVNTGQLYASAQTAAVLTSQRLRDVQSACLKSGHWRYVDRVHMSRDALLHMHLSMSTITVQGQSPVLHAWWTADVDWDKVNPETTPVDLADVPLHGLFDEYTTPAPVYTAHFDEHGIRRRARAHHFNHVLVNDAGQMYPNVQVATCFHATTQADINTALDSSISVDRFGQHWRSVPVEDLTKEQLMDMHRFVDDFLAKRITPLPVKTVINPRQLAGRRAGGRTKRLNKVSRQVADAIVDPTARAAYLRGELLADDPTMRLQFRCSSCGERFSTSLTNFERQAGTRCRKCIVKDNRRRQRMITASDEVAELLVDDEQRRAYLAGEVDPKRTKVRVHCVVCGHVHSTTVASLVYGYRSVCPGCAARRSDEERVLFSTVARMCGSRRVHANRRDLLDGRLELDVYVPHRTLAFEYNGTFWHRDAVVPSGEDARVKWRLALAHNLRLVTLHDVDFNDLDEVVQRALWVSRIEDVEVEEITGHAVAVVYNERRFTVRVQVQGASTMLLCDDPWTPEEVFLRVAMRFSGPLRIRLCNDFTQGQLTLAAGYVHAGFEEREYWYASEAVYLKRSDVPSHLARIYHVFRTGWSWFGRK